MNYVLALISAGMLVALFAPFNATWMAPAALTPLLIAVAREKRPMFRFFLGWAAGIVFWFFVCTWIQFVLEVHGGMGRWGGWATFILFSLAKGLHLAVFALLGGWLIRRFWAVPAVAALWVGLERTHGTFGFAWLTLGNAGIDMPLPMRLAPDVGVYGLSFVFALIACAAAVLLLRRWRELVWLLPLGLLPLFPALPEPQTGTEFADVVQPNMPEESDWGWGELQSSEQRLTQLSFSQAEGARLIVWPEVPGPFYFYSDPVFRDLTQRIAREAHTYFLFGTVAQTPTGAPLNSAVLLSPEGEVIGRYDKMYLVPFGEFVPKLFSFVNRITKEAGDFESGKHIVVLPFAGHKLATFICYESAFPHLVRRFVKGGADVLVNISNDGYFGHSAAREQHLSLVRMRAAENRRWIIRATNDGITAVVDPAGRVSIRLPLYRQFAAKLLYSYVEQETPYSRYGDWFAWSCLLAAVLLALREAGAFTRALRRFGPRVPRIPAA
ncbi:MAG: apolipoprotein N-acyltransferase [Bryobacteraceae bacterium]